MTTTLDSPPPHSPNRLLACLPLAEYHRLRPGLQVVDLDANATLVEPHVPISKVYFLGGGACCINVMTADGRGAGVAIVGNEGAIGVDGFFSDLEGRTTATVEMMNGNAEVMDINVFRYEMTHTGVFNDVIHRYCQTFMDALMQSVACNALHSIEQRYARCLLEIRDRVGHNEFTLTQDALADMLGVRRASISVAIGALDRSRIIEHGHKRIVILDAGRLERTACECYAVIKNDFARLLA